MSLLRLKSRIAKLESRISEDHKTLPETHSRLMVKRKLKGRVNHCRD